jgi:hypothetical protein
MPSRPDLREIASNVKEAFADADRETLLEVLTFVIKEYVVEGPPPMMIHQAETLADLRAPSFAQLISALQTRFDHPELAMFVVDGEQVSVRVGGVVQPLLAGRQPPAAELPRPQAGVRVVEASASLAQRPPPAAPAEPARPARPAVQIEETVTRPAPPPSRGLSVRGQPGSGGGGGGMFGGGGGGAGGNAPARPAPAPTPPPAPADRPAAAAAPPAAAPPAAPDKPEPSGDDASARFSLLELD